MQDGGPPVLARFGVGLPVGLVRPVGAQDDIGGVAHPGGGLCDLAQVVDDPVFDGLDLTNAIPYIATIARRASASLPLGDGDLFDAEEGGHVLLVEAERFAAGFDFDRVH